MAGRFRVVDTGVLEGRFNIAIDQAMIEEHQAGRIPDTLRFMRFPPTALIGRHQALRQEVDVDYCHAHGIGIVRRITGGGAIYLDEGQLGWGLVFQRKALGATCLAGLASDICEAVAGGMRGCMSSNALKDRSPAGIASTASALCFMQLMFGILL